MRRADLTGEEQDRIFEMRDAGHSYAEVARELSISPVTVSNHVMARNREFERVGDYHNYLAQEKDFKNHSSYQDFLFMRDHPDYSGRRFTKSHDEMERLVSETEQYGNDDKISLVYPFRESLTSLDIVDLKSDMSVALQKLREHSEKHRGNQYVIIQEIFFGGKSVVEIARERGVSKMTVNRSKIGGLKKLEFICRKIGLAP